MNQKLQDPKWTQFAGAFTNHLGIFLTFPTGYDLWREYSKHLPQDIRENIENRGIIAGRQQAESYRLIVLKGGSVNRSLEEKA